MKAKQVVRRVVEKALQTLKIRGGKWGKQNEKNEKRQVVKGKRGKSETKEGKTHTRKITEKSKWRLLYPATLSSSFGLGGLVVRAPIIIMGGPPLTRRILVFSLFLG